MRRVQYPLRQSRAVGVVRIRLAHRSVQCGGSNSVTDRHIDWIHRPVSDRHAAHSGDDTSPRVSVPVKGTVSSTSEKVGLMSLNRMFGHGTSDNTVSPSANMTFTMHRL